MPGAAKRSPLRGKSRSKSPCQGRRSYYTVPIKALANEKFLSLCHVLGPENVGMITGDATVTRDLLSTNLCTKEEKHAIAREVDSEENSISIPEADMLTSPL